MARGRMGECVCVCVCVLCSKIDLLFLMLRFRLECYHDFEIELSSQNNHERNNNNPPNNKKRKSLSKCVPKKCLMCKSEIRKKNNYTNRIQNEYVRAHVSPRKTNICRIKKVNIFYHHHHKFQFLMINSTIQ